MKRSNKARTLRVSAAERAQLESIARAPSLPAALVRRASMVLAMAAGESNSAVARRFGVSRPTAVICRRRFAERGIRGLRDELKPGRPRNLSEERIGELIKTALSKPSGQPHWSRRSLADETGVSKSTVHRYLSLFGVQPHRSRSLRLADDPFFFDKVRDIVGLYLNRHEQALVLCVDGKSEVPALELTQALLPLGLDYAEGVAEDYVRYGTAPLFAALDRANGSVLTRCKVRHPHREFLAFLRHLETSVPPKLDVHLICGSYATDKHPRVRAWLAQRARFHLHFTPSYGSWINHVERWFALLTHQAIRRGSFDSVTDLKRRIDTFVGHYNQHPRPFVWTATADSILSKIERLSKSNNGTPRQLHSSRAEPPVGRIGMGSRL